MSNLIVGTMWAFLLAELGSLGGLLGSHTRSRE